MCYSSNKLFFDIVLMWKVNNFHDVTITLSKSFSLHEIETEIVHILGNVYAIQISSLHKKTADACSSKGRRHFVRTLLDCHKVKHHY